MIRLIGLVLTRVLNFTIGGIVSKVKVGVGVTIGVNVVVDVLEGVKVTVEM